MSVLPPLSNTLYIHHSTDVSNLINARDSDVYCPIRSPREALVRSIIIQG